MSELVRYLALAGALFSVGLYGLFVRRSPFALMLSLGVMLCALTLGSWAFNHFIRPVDMNGYLFGGLLALLALVYAFLARPLLHRNRAVDERVNVRLAGGSDSSHEVSHEDIISLAGLPLSVSLALVFIVGYMLARVSIAGLVAFCLGVLALKFIMFRRYQKHLGRLSIPSRTSVPAQPAGLDVRETTSKNPFTTDQGN